MNRDIYDMRFDGSEEDLILQDFITRAEPANAVNERLMARIYEKIQADKAQKRRRWWRVAAAVAVPLVACSLWLGLNMQHGQQATKQQAERPKQVVASVMQELAVPTGHTLTFTLPDGTRMTANSRTRIRYPKPFRAHTRDIYIIGEGEERKNLEEKIKEYGIKKSFILLGKRENPYPYILKAKYFGLFSYAEGYRTCIR